MALVLTIATKTELFAAVSVKIMCSRSLLSVTTSASKLSTALGSRFLAVEVTLNTIGSPARMADVAFNDAGLVENPAKAPCKLIGCSPEVVRHMVCGTANDAFASEFAKWNTSNAVGWGCPPRLTMMSTLFDGRDSVCPPEVHSAWAVLLMILGSDWACAGRQAAAKWAAAASAPARLTRFLVSGFIRSWGDRRRSHPSPFVQINRWLRGKQACVFPLRRYCSASRKQCHPHTNHWLCPVCRCWSSG